LIIGYMRGASATHRARRRPGFDKARRSIRCFDPLVTLVCVDKINQDLLGVLIERGESERGAIGLRAHDPGGKTAVHVLSLALEPNHQLQIGPFGQRESGFNKCTLKADVPQRTFSQLDTVMGKYLDVDQPTRPKTTFIRRWFLAHKLLLGVCR
jgi:hypothetical protein